MPTGGEPVLALAGENPAIVGGPVVTFTLKPADPPPGAGFDISPLRVPGSSVCAAGRVNTIVLPEAAPATPASVDIVEAVKPVPATVTAAAPDPAAISAGLTLATTGGGFVFAFTVNVRACVVPPPGAGFVTDTAFGPADNSFAGIVTVIDVRAADCGE